MIAEAEPKERSLEFDGAYEKCLESGNGLLAAASTDDLICLLDAVSNYNQACAVYDETGNPGFLMRMIQLAENVVDLEYAKGRVNNRRHSHPDGDGLDSYGQVLLRAAENRLKELREKSKL